MCHIVINMNRRKLSIVFQLLLSYFSNFECDSEDVETVPYNKIKRRNNILLTFIFSCEKQLYTGTCRSVGQVVCPTRVLMCSK